MTENSGHNSSDGYEKRDVNVGLLTGLALAIIAVIVVVLVAVTDFFTVAREDLVQRISNDPVSQELIDLRAREAEALGTYRLLDSTTGRYQIPIERAIELIIEQDQNRRN